MKRKQWLFLIVLAVIFVSQLSCGRKAPPFVPKERFDLRVVRLKGEWKGNDVFLNGRMAIPQDGEKAISQIRGCRVYYARFSLSDPPCETCPINYKVYYKIEGEMIRGDKFSCRLEKEKKKGLHFFEVRLIGRSGALGPSSNRVKLKIDR